MRPSIDERVAEFKKRIEVEREFCLELYHDQTIRLLAMKYLYYVIGSTPIKDQQYDNEETSWYVMGRGLGVLREDETSPCVDFNADHPLANDAISLANQWIKGHSRN